MKRTSEHGPPALCILAAILLLAPAVAVAAQDLKLDLKKDMLIVYEGRQPILQIQAHSLPGENQVGIIIVDGSVGRDPSVAHRSPLLELAEKALRGDQAAFKSLMEAGTTTDPARAALSRMRPKGPSTPKLEPGDNFRDWIDILSAIGLAHKGDRNAQAAINQGKFNIDVGNIKQKLPRGQIGVIAAKAVPVPKAEFTGKDDDLAGLMNAAHQAWSQRDRKAMDNISRSAANAGIGFLEVKSPSAEGKSTDPSDYSRRSPHIEPGDNFHPGVYLLVDSLGLLAWDDQVERPLVIAVPAPAR